MSERRIFVFSELYWPEETSTGHFVTGIAEGLARCWPVTAACVQPTYAAHGTRAPRREERRGVSVRRCRSTSFHKDFLPLRLVNFLTISAALFLFALRHLRRGDLALVVTNPPLLPYLVARACRLRGARFVLLVHDVYPDVLVRTGVLGADGWVVRRLERAAGRLFERAERIVTLGRDQQRLAAGYTGNREDKFVRIPNWADLEEIQPQPRDENPLLSSLGLTGKFVVQYSGNMGRTHGLEDLLATAERLRSEPDVHFLLVGGGGKRAWAEASAARRGLANVILLDPRPREELAVSLNACDVAILAMAPGMAGVSVPSRIYNILAAGKPLIAVADEESEPAAVVREERIGWVIPPGRPEALAEAVLEARRNPALLVEMGRQSRRAAETRYTYEQAVAAYQRLVEEQLG